MTMDAREVLAEALWPEDTRRRAGVRAAVSAPEAGRVLGLLRILGSDAGAIARIRAYRRHAHDVDPSEALDALTRDLDARLCAGVPRALFGDPGRMVDARTGARILASVLSARRAGHDLSDPRRPGGGRITRGRLVAAVREVLCVNDSAGARGCITRGLSDPDWHVRCGLVRLAAGLLGHRDIRAAWGGVLRDEDSRVRALAVRKLGARAGRKDVDPLISIGLEDIDARVRLEAVKAALKSRHLAPEIALMAFDPASEIAGEVRSQLSPAVLDRSLSYAARSLETEREVPVGLLRVVYRDAGLPPEAVRRHARRRLALLWRLGTVRELAVALQALEWVARPCPATCRLARRIAGAHDVERACLALVRRWPAEAAVGLGLRRLRVRADAAPSLRAALCDGVAERAQGDPELRAAVLRRLGGSDDVTRASLVWAAGHAFPQSECGPAFDALISDRDVRQDDPVVRTIWQVRARWADHARS